MSNLFFYRIAGSDNYSTQFGTVEIPQEEFSYAGRTIDRHGFVVNKSLEKSVSFYPDDDVPSEQSVSRDV